MGDIIIFTWDWFKKDFFKNTVLFSCFIIIPILSYNNFKKSEEINNLTILNKSSFQNSLNPEELIATNHKNWNFLFQNNIYDLYKSDSILSDFIDFSNNELQNLYHPKMSKLDVYEYNLKASICKLIYNQVHGEILVNPMNYYQILFEVDMCFKKIGYLLQDKIMNDLLFKYNGTNYPYYNPSASALNKILKEKGHLPLSCDVEFLKKFGDKNCLENLHYSHFNIKKFE